MKSWLSRFRPTVRAGELPVSRRSAATAGPLTIYGETNAGKQRQSNEDALYYNAAYGLAVVADGLGGHAAGEKASALAMPR